jgi:lysophospholipase L1-like esterase
MPSYFAATLDMLKNIDFSEIDYITIGYGTNDYTGDVWLDYREGLEEYQYFKGALKYSIRTILNTYPNNKIVVISPCWRWFIEDNNYSYSSDDEQSKNNRDLYLTDYVDACEAVCKELHIPYIDTYYTLGFNEYTHLAYFPPFDGTHMNQAGRQLRADRIEGQLNALF